jgi:hypothetical protein
MSTQVTITLVSYCAAEGHVTVDVTAEGVAGSRRLTYEVSELRNAVDWSDAERITRDLLRLHFRGMTANQAKNDLDGDGITVTV